jgi:hypothetical protein
MRGADRLCLVRINPWLLFCGEDSVEVGAVHRTARHRGMMIIARAIEVNRPYLIGLGCGVSINCVSSVLIPWLLFC